jgi:hypothetical protein
MVDPATGHSVRIGSVPNLEWVLYGGGPVDDQQNRRVYLVGLPSVSGAETLYVVDEAAGTVVKQTALDEDGGFNWSGGMHVRADHSLVGVTWHRYVDGGGIEELRAIDTDSGTSSLIAPVPKLDFLLDQAHAIDPVTGIIYVLGYSAADSTCYLHRLNATSGADALSVPLGAQGPDWYQLFVRSDGTLLAVQFTGGDAGVQLVSVDPSLGTPTAIGGSLGLEDLLTGSTYDRVADRAYLLTSDQSGRTVLVVIDAFSGAKISSVVLADDAGQQLNWSGGLHVYH